MRYTVEGTFAGGGVQLTWEDGYLTGPAIVLAAAVGHPVLDDIHGVRVDDGEPLLAIRTVPSQRRPAT